MTGCMSGLNQDSSFILSKGLQQLKNEHPPLLERLDELLDLSLKIEEGEQIEADFSRLKEAVVEFLSELEPHSEREEGVLFEMMAGYIGREMGPIAVMEYEHDQAKRFIGTFLHNTKGGTEGFTKEQMAENAQLIKNANYTLVSHFAKEESILFPMAENMLSEEEKQELAERIKLI
ncbi:hemerythrin domain-containing protein [Mesobacillus subterraneus]|uniref:Hemerythrin domain-containing protein n=1 Tax=Mesobacillus subterraneus TaxID=285983 RepID=A0A3R9FHN2_9BACI|nr:hemerythrin domain-containing protein [Mesobacillus subterraneus]RSD28228.1 hemerythrin domain-containing protein [Mesobacillus subterraneus]